MVIVNRVKGIEHSIHSKEFLSKLRSEWQTKFCVNLRLKKHLTIPKGLAMPRGEQDLKQFLSLVILLESTLRNRLGRSPIITIYNRYLLLFR